MFQDVNLEGNMDTWEYRFVPKKPHVQALHILLACLLDAMTTEERFKSLHSQSIWNLSSEEQSTQATLCRRNEEEIWDYEIQCTV